MYSVIWFFSQRTSVNCCDLSTQSATISAVCHNEWVKQARTGRGVTRCSVWRWIIPAEENWVWAQTLPERDRVSSPDSHVFTKLMSVCVCTQVKYRMGATNYANKDCGHNSTDDTDFKEEPKWCELWDWGWAKENELLVWQKAQKWPQCQTRTSVKRCAVSQQHSCGCLSVTSHGQTRLILFLLLPMSSFQLILHKRESASLSIPSALTPILPSHFFNPPSQPSPLVLDVGDDLKVWLHLLAFCPISEKDLSPFVYYCLFSISFPDHAKPPSTPPLIPCLIFCTLRSITLSPFRC